MIWRAAASPRASSRCSTIRGTSSFVSPNRTGIEGDDEPALAAARHRHSLPPCATNDAHHRQRPRQVGSRRQGAPRRRHVLRALVKTAEQLTVSQRWAAILARASGVPQRSPLALTATPRPKLTQPKVANRKNQTGKTTPTAIFRLNCPAPPRSTRSLTGLGVSETLPALMRYNRIRRLREATRLSLAGKRRSYGHLLKWLVGQAWYQSPEPSEPLDQRLWCIRAALLDALAYHPWR